MAGNNQERRKNIIYAHLYAAVKSKRIIYISQYHNYINRDTQPLQISTVAFRSITAQTGKRKSSQCHCQDMNGEQSTFIKKKKGIYCTVKPRLSELRLSEHSIIQTPLLGPRINALIYMYEQPRLSERFCLVPASSDNRGCTIHVHDFSRTGKPCNLAYSSNSEDSASC